MNETGRPAPRTTASEDDYNRWFCSMVNGETETRHGYTSAGGRRYVEVDCETGTMVYEGGLDKRSSLDSVQQALFYSHVTGKRPAVVIYDTDGREGRFEYRIRIACRKAGVRYEVFRKRAVEISAQTGFGRTLHTLVSGTRSGRTILTILHIYNIFVEYV